VVIAAAGKSERLGGGAPKQFRPVAGVPLLLRTIRPFLSHPEVAQVIAVLPTSVAADPPAWLGDLVGERLRAVAGGATRADSVAAGVGVLQEECSIVLVHDGARPYPSRPVIDAVIAAARNGSAAIAAVPLHDTLKEAGGEMDAGSPTVRGTVSRAGLWRAQTPQGFPRATLEAAIARAGTRRGMATDESQLVEEMGERVLLIRDSETNLKITTEDDFRIAEALALLMR
jgi:2-C-methyl-D-erythritol 4-phosphate cytidylyltransferase